VWWFSRTRDPNPGPAFFFVFPPSPMTGSSPHLQGVDRDALQRVVEPVVRAHGAEVVDMELKPDQGGWVLRVFVEKAGASAQNLSTKDAAVNLELCADVSRDLSPALDVVDLIPHAYSLEVSSPGVERPLRGERDFARFAGQKAKLRLSPPLDGQRVLVGTIEGVHGGKVRVRDGSRVHEAPLDAIESARLVFEFGTSGREHKRKHRG
ncbi:MAG: ribosome maturation factor RimP, partial [Polyangiaceae bacterium]